jgi:hypothetical protein
MPFEYGVKLKLNIKIEMVRKNEIPFRDSKKHEKVSN